jgi:integrase
VRFLIATRERRGEALGAHWSDFDPAAESLTMTGNVVQVRGVVAPDKPIFPNSRGGYVNASNLTNRHWVPFRKRAGYEWVTFHTFRKTVGTLLNDDGLTVREIADQLGHKRVSITQDTYFGRSSASPKVAALLEVIDSEAP